MDQAVQTSASVVVPPLAEGEYYAGIILGKDGAPIHHLIGLPGEIAGATWKKARAFAKKAGGDLPTLRELALLRANARDQFVNDWYWSGEQHAVHSGYAWCQDFGSGSQYCYGTDGKLRARAVRRASIQ